MPEPRALSSRQRQEAMAEELYPDIFAFQPPGDAPVHDDQAASTTGHLPALRERATTGQIMKVSAPLVDAATTQSLIMALRSTVSGPKRKVVIIPGKRQAAGAAQGVEQPARRLPHRWRWGLTLCILLFFLSFSIFTLTPLSAGQTDVPLVGGLIQFVHMQEQNLGIFSAHQAPATPAPVLPNMNLPKSQYVAIARQDAIDAGIPPDYFVRQINAESGFNPNAVSPAGAVGIAQFLPSTAAGLGFDPYDPIAALKGAAKYMATYYNKYGQDYAKALAAYNAGSGTVDHAVSVGGANWMNYIP
ncbi:MAG: lytic transglycosylase domain-containing protein, partial [Ktedonobacteraceae bacterium]|nr:lytic transglycosylase domain-containing protein [Ktedonobacteraceae bacterium]